MNQIHTINLLLSTASYDSRYHRDYILVNDNRRKLSFDIFTIGIISTDQRWKVSSNSITMANNGWLIKTQNLVQTVLGSIVNKKERKKGDCNVYAIGLNFCEMFIPDLIHRFPF